MNFINSNNIFKLKIVSNYKTKKRSLAVVSNKSNSNFNSNKVVEKIGAVSYSVVSLNIFRLAFWLSKNPEISPSAFRLLKRCNIF